MSVLSVPYTERDGSEFATYGDMTVEYRDSSHRYWIHKDGERRPAISVTSALKVLDKPALISWAERCGVEGALRLERAGELKDVPVEQATEIVRINGMGSDAKRDAGADRGTALHDALQLYVEQGTVPTVGDFDPAVRGYVQALCKWLLAAKPDPIASEVIVGSAISGYAGRFDLLATIDGRRTLVDLKTSKRVYAEHHLQIAAYMLALEECGETPADCGLVVAVGEDGEFHSADCCSDSSHFLAVLACHRALVQVRAGVKALEKA
jgi:genome maintenance exonuclease 1